MKIPWKSFAAARTEREYVALVSFLPLKSFRSVPRFLTHSLKIQRQLSGSKGLIGYSLEARLFSKKFWTLSVWESEQALREFVRQSPHGAAMTALVADMGKTRFFTYKISGSAVPPDWAEAKKLLE